MKIQERNFLLLREDEESKVVRDILKSPLELAENLITDFIENRLDSLKESLDSIKQFAAGVASAEQKRSYTLARLYPYYFAFHQFVHSSFRARQGKVLERIFHILFGQYRNIEVLSKSDQKRLLNANKQSIPDFDLFLKISDREAEEYLVVQIRSRDDTGGTTAKTSLVEGLKYLKEKLCNKNRRIHYIVFVWEELNSSQRKTTINKFYSFLSDYLTATSKSEFEKILNRNEAVKIDCINLYFVHGTEAFLNVLRKTLDLNEDIKAKLKKILKDITDWDDFWVAYSVIGKEYEEYKQSGRSTIHDMISLLRKYPLNLNRLKSYEDYKRAADQLATLFWKYGGKEYFESGDDNYLYFRDVAFLILIYFKKKIT